MQVLVDLWGLPPSRQTGDEMAENLGKHFALRIQISSSKRTYLSRHAHPPVGIHLEATTPDSHHEVLIALTRTK